MDEDATETGWKSTSQSTADNKEGAGTIKAAVSQPVLSLATQLQPTKPNLLLDDSDNLHKVNERMQPLGNLFALRKQYQSSLESLEFESSGKHYRTGGNNVPTSVEIHQLRKACVL